MPYEYYNIAHEWYEEIKPFFINYIYRNFNLSRDEVYDIYHDTWVEVHKIIREERAENDTKWRALIFKIGWRRANKVATRRPQHQSIDDGAGSEGDDERFNKTEFEMEKAVQEMQYQSVYADPELQALLGTELNYIPNPCRQILNFYYFDNMSMQEIAECMNYKTARSAITTKKRCFEKFKARMWKAARRLGIFD